MADAFDEHRGDVRTSLFAAAILDTGAVRFPVRIRNISPTGALIQGDDLPLPGTDVIVLRGSLSAAGQIRWSRGGRAGLQFAGAVRVSEWLSSCSSKTHQKSVDDLVAAIRAGIAPVPLGESGRPMPFQAPQDAAGKLLQARTLITAVAERLAADAAVLERHGDGIQQLDAAASILASLM